MVNEWRDGLGDAVPTDGIQTDTPVHNGDEDGEAGRKRVRKGLNLELESIEGTQGNLPDGGEGGADEDEGHGIHQHLVVGRREEVGVCEKRPAFFKEAG